MRVYSKSLGKVIDVPDSGTTNLGSTSSTGVQPMGGLNSDLIQQLQTLITMKGLGDLKNISKYSTATTMLKDLVPKESAEEKKSKLATQNVEKVITQLENEYFNNKLYYGNNIKGVLADTVMATINPNEPYVKWKQMLESKRPLLAKAAGDTGNIAFAEQLQAGKPFPSARADKKTAEARFDSIREGFGLKPKYGKSAGGMTNTGLESIGGKYGL